MRNSVDNIIRSLLNRPKAEINSLYFPYDGLFEQSLISNKYKHYTMVQNQIYPSAPQIYPENFFVLPEGILSYITELDLVIANHRKDQLPVARKFANMHHLPLILIDHELPATDAPKKLRAFVSKQFNDPTMVTVFDSLVSTEWCCDIDVLSHYGGQAVPGIDKSICDEKDIDLCFVGDYVQSDFNMITTILQSIPNAIALGNNPGITQQYNAFADIIQLMYKSKICVQVVQEGRPPLLMLYCMSLGCIPIINQTKWTEKWIDEDVGIMFKGIDEIKNIADNLLGDPDKIKRMGEACIDLINSQFDSNIFQKAFELFIDNSVQSVYTREALL